MNLTDSEDEQQISIEERRAARRQRRAQQNAAEDPADGETDEDEDPRRLSPTSSSRGRDLSPPLMSRSRSDASPVRPARGRSRRDLSPTRINKSARDLSPSAPSRSRSSSPIRKARSLRAGFGAGDTSPNRPNRTISRNAAPTVNVLDHSFSVTTSKMNLMADKSSNNSNNNKPAVVGGGVGGGGGGHHANAGLDMSIKIIQGKGLAACDTDMFGRDTSSDPYVIASIFVNDEGDQQKEILIGQTKHISATLNPKWDVTLSKEIPPGTFKNSNNSYTLQLKLMDYDRFDDDDCMGIVKIPMKVESLSKASDWYDIPRDSAEKASGQIQLAVETKIHYSMDTFLHNPKHSGGTDQKKETTASANNNKPVNAFAAAAAAAATSNEEKPKESSGSGAVLLSPNKGGKKGLSKLKQAATATIASNKIIGKGVNVASKVTGKGVNVASKVTGKVVGAGKNVAHTAIKGTAKVAHKTTDVAHSAAGAVFGKDNVNAVTEAATSAASAIVNATNDVIDAAADVVDATADLLHVGGPSEDDDEYENIYKEEECFEFKLTVIQGDDLAPKDTNFIGKKVSSDPYVVVEVWPKGIPMDGKPAKAEPIEFGKSHTIPKTLKPFWNHTFDTFYHPITEMDMEEAQFRVRIYDDDFGLGIDDKMGHVDVYLQPKKHLDIKEKWYHVSVTSASGAKGRMQLSWQTNQLMHNRVVGRRKIEKEIVEEPEPVQSTSHEHVESSHERPWSFHQREESSHQKEELTQQQEDEMAASMPARFLLEEEPAPPSAILSADRIQSLDSIQEKEKRKSRRSGSVPTEKERRHRRRRSHGGHREGADGERPKRPSSSRRLVADNKEGDGEVERKTSSSRRARGEKSKKSGPRRRATSPSKSGHRDEAKKGSRRAASQPPKSGADGSRQRRAQSVEPTAMQRKPSSRHTIEKEESRRATSKRDLHDGADGEKKRISKSGRSSRRVTSSKSKEMDNSAASSSSRQNDDIPKESSSSLPESGDGGEERKRVSRSSRHLDGSSSRHHNRKGDTIDGSSSRHHTRKSGMDGGSSSRHHTRKSGMGGGSSSRHHTRKSGMDGSGHLGDKSLRKKSSRGESVRLGKKGSAEGSSRKSSSAGGKSSSRSSRASGTHATSPKRVSDGHAPKDRRDTESSEFQMSFSDARQLQKMFLDAQAGKSKLQQTMEETEDIFSLGHRVSTAASTSFPDTVH